MRLNVYITESAGTCAFIFNLFMDVKYEDVDESLKPFVCALDAAQGPNGYATIAGIGQRISIFDATNYYIDHRAAYPNGGYKVFETGKP